MSEEKEQKLKEYQKNIERQRILSIIMNQIIVLLWFNSVCAIYLTLHY